MATNFYGFRRPFVDLIHAKLKQSLIVYAPLYSSYLWIRFQMFFYLMLYAPTFINLSSFLKSAFVNIIVYLCFYIIVPKLILRNEFMHDIFTVYPSFICTSLTKFPFIANDTEIFGIMSVDWLMFVIQKGS